VGAAEEGTLGGTFNFADVAAGGLFAGEVVDGGALADVGGLLNLHDDAEDDVQGEVEIYEKFRFGSEMCRLMHSLEGMVSFA
jgi:hypothetical protein